MSSCLSSRMLNGTIDLKDSQYDKGNQSAYDRLLQLSSEIAIGGKTLRQALRQKVGTESYLRKDTLDLAGETNPRAQEISKVIKRYRKKAMSTLLSENPTLRSARTADIENKRARRAGLGIDL